MLTLLKALYSLPLWCFFFLLVQLRVQHALINTVMYSSKLLFSFGRSKEYGCDYEKKKVEMNKAQEETTVSYQKKKVCCFAVCNF